MLLCYSSISEGQVYYVSSQFGSDIDSCGATSSTPCSSVYYVLNSTLTQQVFNGGTCFTSPSNGPLSIILLEGNHIIDPVCLAAIDNFTISSQTFANIYSSIFGNLYGIIYLLDSSNVTITNLNFVDSVIGRSTIYAHNTSNIRISNCSIPVYADGASGLGLVNPQGSVTITNIKIYGNRVLNSISEDLLHHGSPGTAFYITIGVGSSYGYYLTEAQLLTTLDPVDIIVENCSFEKITFETDQGIYDYRQTSQRSKVMRVTLTRKAVGNKIIFRDCMFENNIDLTGSIALTNIENAQDNMVEFQHCTFQHNFALFGGGIGAYFSGGDTLNNTISVTDSTFLYNKATQEGGGVFTVTLASSPQSNNLIIMDSLFSHNLAVYGASVFLFNDPVPYLEVSSDVPIISQPLMKVTINNSSFKNNKAVLSEGVVNALRINLQLSGTK